MTVEKNPYDLPLLDFAAVILGGDVVTRTLEQAKVQEHPFEEEGVLKLSESYTPRELLKTFIEYYERPETEVRSILILERGFVFDLIYDAVGKFSLNVTIDRDSKGAHNLTCSLSWIWE